MKKSKMVDWGIYIYILLFIFYSFSGRIMPLSLFIGDKINSLIYEVFAVGGCILIFFDILTVKKAISTKYFSVLGAFVLIMALSSIVNFNLGYVDNVKTIIWTIIQITIFYSLYLRVKKEQIKDILIYMFSAISIIWTLAVMVSLLQFVVQDVYMYDITNVGYKYQGFWGGRLFGIFNDPNYAAVTSAYVVLMLVYLCISLNRRWYKLLLIGWGLLVNILYIQLSGSRTAILASMCSFFICAFLMIKNMFINNRHEILYSGISALSIVIIVLLLSVSLQKIVVIMPQMYMENFAVKVGHMTQHNILTSLLRGRGDVIIYWEKSPLYAETKSNEKNDSGRADDSYDKTEAKEKVKVKEETEKSAEDILKRKDVGLENISNNRIEIWKEYIQGIKGKFLLGTSPRNMLTYLEKTGKAELVLYRKYETHSGYLSVLVGCGIIGCIPVVIFCVLIGKRVLKYCFCGKEIEKEFIVLLSILSLILIYTAFFTELFFVNNLTTALFWSMLGFLWFWLENDKQEDVDDVIA